MMLRITEQMRPLVLCLLKIIDHPHGSKIINMASHTSDLQLQGQSVVYARFNLCEGSLYIGETQEWKQRCKQHYKATWMHAKEAPSDIRCTKCRENRKYCAHRVARPSAWIMLPLQMYANKTECKRVESALERRWRPNLNRWEYGKTNKYIQMAKAKWVTTYKPRRQHDRQQSITKKPAVTHFYTESTKYGSERFSSLVRTLSTFSTRNCGFRIQITKGEQDDTDWGKCIHKFGDTIVKYGHPNYPQRMRTTLRMFRNHLYDTHGH